MATAQAHIIDKVVVDVNCNSMERALFLKDHIDVLLNQEVFPKLEAWLEAQGLYLQNYYQLEALNLDLNTTSSNLSSDLADRLCEKIKDEISRSIKKKITASESTDFKPLEQNKRHTQAFLYFLKTGNLPWYFNEGEKLNLDEVAKTIDQIGPDLKNLLTENPNALKRLAFQYATDSQFLKSLLPILLSGNSKSIRSFQNCYSKITDSKYREALLVLVLECFTEAPVSRINQALKRIMHILFQRKKEVYISDLMGWARLIENPLELRLNNSKVIIQLKGYNHLKNNALKYTIYPDKILNFKNERLPNSSKYEVHDLLKNLVSKEILRPTKKEQTPNNSTQADSGSLIVQQAGLVLLHPFLPALFSELHFLSQSKQLLESKRDTAVHILHFLATGNLRPHEAELGFEKYLCGLPQQFPVRREVKLTQEQLQEASHLLKTAIQHWSALKNTSPAGLRGQFLTRSGKLSFNSEYDQLHLQRVTADILLDQLPWGLSLMKLPWLQKLLHINW